MIDLNDDAVFLAECRKLDHDKRTRSPRVFGLAPKGCEVCHVGPGQKVSKAGRQYFSYLTLVTIRLLDGRVGGQVKLCQDCHARLQAQGAVV